LYLKTLILCFTMTELQTTYKTCIHMYIHTYIHTYIHIHVLCIHTYYINTYIHRYKHTHKNIVIYKLVVEHFVSGLQMCHLHSFEGVVYLRSRPPYCVVHQNSYPPSTDRVESYCNHLGVDSTNTQCKIIRHVYF